MPNNLNELKGAPYNPRTITREKQLMLKRSLQEYGDLSGVVFNRTTGQLVGGHMRVEAFKEMSSGQPVKFHLDQIERNEQGTVAVGYVKVGDEWFNYREVEWDIDKEKRANLAANQLAGEWDEQALAELLTELAASTEGTHGTGFTDEEVDAILDKFGPSETDPLEDLAKEEEARQVECPECGHKFTP